MEYESPKATYRIVKRTYSDEKVKFIIQMKDKRFKVKDKWSDLLLKRDTIEQASKVVHDLIIIDTPEKYKDEIMPKL